MQIEKWKKFTKSQQLGAIAAEIMRASVWQDKDRENFLSALERAMGLIDVSLEDRRWKNYLPMLFWLRNKMAEFYVGITKEKIEILYNAL
ncbi:MAG: hypothetical protein HY773_02480 [Candidatus Terrybacteria bacterium]|nr:hypothetical protein [Candidatus Terrybacteria bacterium]